MRLSYTRASEYGGYNVVGDEDTPAVLVRRNGHRWEWAETPTDSYGPYWSGKFNTREIAAQEGVRRTELDRDRLRAREALACMGAGTSFDTVAGEREEWSPGARFCLRVWDAAQEGFREDGDAYQPGNYESLYSRAENMVPYHTHSIWKIFVDLCAYDFSEIDEEQNERGKDQSVTDWASVILIRMAETAMIQLADGWYQDRKCADCDEYPCECHLCADCYGDTRPAAIGTDDACTCDPNADPDPGIITPGPAPETDDTPRCTRCSAPVADYGLTGQLCGECTDRMHAETAPNPVSAPEADDADVCCAHCPKDCDGDHDPVCDHCITGCC
jgi:hypothetical protein